MKTENLRWILGLSNLKHNEVNPLWEMGGYY